MEKKLSIILIVCCCLACCIVLLGCSDNKKQNNYLIVVDMEGANVNVPTNVKKVACISQSATDFMIAFGLGDKIVGTYRSFTYNTWATELYPNAANYKAYSYSASAEELIADGIELVITQDTENAEAFRNAGLPVVAVHQYSSTGAFDDEVYDTARIIGEIFPEAKEKADAWIQEVKDTIADIESEIGTQNSDKNIYYVNGEKAKGLYYSDGGNSMISRILDVANVNLATEKYEVLNVHKVSDEEMVKLNPYAMMIGGTYQNKLAKALEESAVWSALDCNKENRVYRIPVCMIGIENVGVETSLMLKYTASLFNDYDFDIKAEMKSCIKKYFNYDLSDQDVENMCKGLSKTGEDMIHD